MRRTDLRFIDTGTRNTQKIFVGKQCMQTVFVKQLILNLHTVKIV